MVRFFGVVGIIVGIFTIIFFLFEFVNYIFCRWNGVHCKTGVCIIKKLRHHNGK